MVPTAFDPPKRHRTRFLTNIQNMATPEHIQECLEKLVGQRSVLGTTVPPSAVSVLDGGTGLGYSQLNELLLLLGFDRVTRSFFQFLIDGTTEYRDGAAIRSSTELIAAVDRFRRLGLLLFGNVKYAFKFLARSADALEERIAALSEIPVERFRARHEPIRPITPIGAERTYYLGYIVEREIADRLKANPGDETAQAQERERQSLVEIGKANQEAYLASDHLDVYVATSMRQRHEFLAVNRLASAIFAHPLLADLKLRWFDPTQAYCKDRIDKGISEALMLRRAKCTIYLAQESETLGKDSELASTLAQGKPVIAFVPAADEDAAKRLLTELLGAFPDADQRQLLLAQLQVFAAAAAWNDPAVRQWLNDPAAMQIDVVEQRLQQVIAKYYNSRAETLCRTHPLGVQVHLDSGVANGVLVVRTVEDCARLVRRIVTRTLEFAATEEDGATVLRETISGCVFRIATGDVMLTNAFWNFYLEPSE